MKSLNFFPLLFFMLVSCSYDYSQLAFSLKSLSPVVLDKKGQEIHQYWEFKNEPFLWKSAPGEVSDLNLFRDSLKSLLGNKQFKKIVDKQASQDDKNTGTSENGDLINSGLVHSGKAGKIREINFIEAQLLNYQLGRYPLLSHQTEFHGFILLNDSLQLVRVYFAASDQPWPPKPKVILEEVEKMLHTGWKLRYHLHNHYEPKSNSYLGILAPSMADAQYFKMLSEEFQLEKALITNGFHTVELMQEEFQKFESH